MSRRGTLQVSVAPELEEKLRQIAACENRSLSNLLRKLIEEALDRRATRGEYYSAIKG